MTVNEPSTPEKAPDGPQERPEEGSATLASPEPLSGPQAGAGGLVAHNAGPTVAECAAADARWWNGEKHGE